MKYHMKYFGICLMFISIGFSVQAMLDSTFGDNGVVNGPGIFSFQVTVPIAMALQSDGKIVAAGTSPDATAIRVVRYENDGSSLDISFGINGIVDVPQTGLIYDLIIDAHDKIVLVGTSDTTNGDGIIIRLNSVDGSPDISFGNQMPKNGVAIISKNELNILTSVNEQDDKLIASGIAATGGNEDNFLIVRFNEDGTLDTTFGNQVPKNGITKGPSNRSSNVWVKSDNSIIAVGFGEPPNFAQEFRIANYTTDGSIVSASQQLPCATADSQSYTIPSLWVDDMGRILMAALINDAQDQTGIIVVRFLESGPIDTSFGPLQGAIYIFGDYQRPKIALGPTGDIWITAEQQSTNLFQLIQLNPNGFFLNKISGLAQPEGLSKDIAIDQNGKIYVAGVYNNNMFRIARYLPLFPGPGGSSSPIALAIRFTYDMCPLG